MKKNPRKKRYNDNPLFLCLVLCLVTFVIIAGGSYAVLKTTVLSMKSTELVASVLAIKYEDGKTINLDNTFPMSDQRGMMIHPYQFSIENIGDIPVNYEISFEQDEKDGNTLDMSYIRYSVKKGDNDWSDPENLTSVFLDRDVSLQQKEKKSYQVRFWLDERSKNETQGKTFKARIVVNAVQEQAPLGDVVAPVIHLNGELSDNVEYGSDYHDLGVKEIVDDHDELDRDSVALSYEYYHDGVLEVVDHVDTQKLGVYYIYYKIKDKSGNEGISVRSVNVYQKDTNPPRISIIGQSNVSVLFSSVYQELGASAEDSEEGNLSDRVVTIGAVNTQIRGTTIIKYLVTDQSGNTASIARTVTVE